jgi:hypothetical protein
MKTALPKAFLAHCLDAWAMLRLSARLLAGRRFWIVPLLPLVWTIFQAVRLLVGWRATRFNPEDVQLTLVGLPLIVLAIGLGVRIIAAEIEQHTLEATYTVPGGAKRVWLWKLGAATVMLLAAQLLLTIATFVLFTSVPIVSFYGAIQAALFYLVLAMTLGALLRNVITAILTAAAIFFVNLLITGFGSEQLRFSPLFNPTRIDEQVQVFEWTLQNFVGFAIAIVLIALLAFERAERREKLLGI